MSDSFSTKKPDRQRKLYATQSERKKSRHSPRQLPADLASWLKQRALYLLARREYSRHELRLKLLSALQRRSQISFQDDEVLTTTTAEENVEFSRNDHFEALIDSLLLELELAGWQSDRRFLASLVRRKAERTGARLLIPELKTHELPADLMEVAREQLNASEFERALALWRRRFGDKTLSVLSTKNDRIEEGLSSAELAAIQYKEKTRQLRFLVSRGFSSAVALAVLKEGAQSILNENGSSLDPAFETQSFRFSEEALDEFLENASDDPHSG